MFDKPPVLLDPFMRAVRYYVLHRAAMLTTSMLWQYECEKALTAYWEKRAREML